MKTKQVDGIISREISCRIGKKKLWKEKEKRIGKRIYRKIGQRIGTIIINRIVDKKIYGKIDEKRRK